MHLSMFIICLIAGAISCYLFGGFVQAHNPFTNDFRVQAYGIAFVAGFLLFRLFPLLIMTIISGLGMIKKKNR